MVFDIIFKKIRKTFGPKREQGNQHFWCILLALKSGFFFGR